MNSHTKSRLYLAAFAFLIFGTAMACSYIEGGIAVRASRLHDQDAMISACRENNAILQRRYDALADESDAVTVIAGELKYQSGRR
jgi:hypothetical protein